MFEELRKSLHEDRLRAWEEAKSTNDKALDEKRAMTSEEQQVWDRCNQAMDEIDGRLEQLDDRERREKTADEARERAEQWIRPRTEDHHERSIDDDFFAWIRGVAAGDPGLKKGFEIPVKGVQFRHDGTNWEVRDLTKGSATAGGNTVGNTFRRQLYVHLIENSGIRQTRATVLTTGNGEQIVMPKTTAHPAAPGTITAEGAGITEVDPTFGQGTLTAYKFAEMTQLSSELIQDTAVDLLGYLAQAFGQALGNGAGSFYITGTGSSQPQGVLVGAGTASTSVTGGTGVSGAPTGDNLIDLVYSLTEPYAMNAEFLMRRATVGVVRKLKDTTNQYIWAPGLVAGAPDTLLNYPVRTDPNMPAAATSATSIAFGDFSKFYIRDVGNLRWERSDEFAFSTDLVSFRAILRTDSMLLDTNAIKTFKGGAS